MIYFEINLENNNYLALTYKYNKKSNFYLRTHTKYSSLSFGCHSIAPIVVPTVY